MNSNLRLFVTPAKFCDKAPCCERQNFADGAAALWLEGELVHLEDLVLHDASMHVRRPTHELTRARRLICSHKPDWPLSRDGLLALTKRGGNLVSELGLREMTGRGRFRAWGVV